MALQDLYQDAKNLFNSGVEAITNYKPPGSQFISTSGESSTTIPQPTAPITMAQKGQLPDLSNTVTSTQNTTTTNPLPAPAPAPAPTPAPTQDQVVDNAQSAADAAAEAARQQAAQFTSNFTAGVQDAFRPIYDALDSQLGIEKRELGAAMQEGIQAGTREEQIAKQYNVDLQGLGEVRDTALQGLGGLVETARGSLNEAISGIQSQAELARESARRQTGQNLREIDEGTRNLVTSGLRRLGAAGDSSAAIAIQNALSRENLRTRGRALGMRDEVMSSIENTIINNTASLQEKFNTIKLGIEGKMADVQNVYATNKSQLNSWKQQQLSNLINVAQERIAQLGMQRAQASQQEKSQLLNLQIQTEQDLMNRLRQLDDEVRQLNTGLDQWALQRAAALEDYGKQLATAAQYGGSTSVSTPNLQFKTVPVYDPVTGNVIGQQQMVFNPATGQTSEPQLISGALTAPPEEDEPGALRQLFSGNFF